MRDIEEEVDRLVFAYKRSLKWQADRVLTLLFSKSTSNSEKGGDIEQQLLNDQQR